MSAGRAGRSVLVTLLLSTLVVLHANATSGTKHEEAKDASVPRVDFDKIKPLPEMLPNNITGQLYKKFQPYLNAKSGCLPYPAINAKGEISKGLAMDAGGSDTELCRSSAGQVYARSGFYGKRFAILYSYFFGRDRTWVSASIDEGAGHIYDWEQVIVWLSAETAHAKIVAVSPSGHGGFQSYPVDDFEMKGTHPLINYSQNWDRVRNHQLLEGDEDEVGELQNIVAWTSMSDTMRKNLNTPGVFSTLTPGIIDADFGRQLEAAGTEL